VNSSCWLTNSTIKVGGRRSVGQASESVSGTFDTLAEKKQESHGGEEHVVGVAPTYQPHEQH